MALKAAALPDYLDGLDNLDGLDGLDTQIVSLYREQVKTPAFARDHPLEATTGWTTTSALSFMNLPLMNLLLLTDIAVILPRPMLLMLLPDADQIAHHDRVDMIACKRGLSVFEQHLA